MSFEDVEEELLNSLLSKKRNDVRIAYINGLKLNADIIVLMAT